MARRRLIRLADVGIISWLLAGATGCAEPPASFVPVSAQGLSISGVFVLVMILSGLVLLLVAGLVVYVLIRHRERPGAREPEQVEGNSRLEIAWTAAAILLLAVIFSVSFPTMRFVDAQTPTALRVRVIGHQWWWEYQYPNLGVVTANEPHLPVGAQLHLEIESADVNHSFWVPQFGRMIDAIPGKVNDLWLHLDKPGVYRGYCSQFCGVQHAGMGIRTVAESPGQFDAWVQQQRQPAAKPQSAAALRGEEVFLQNTCVSCHTIQGTSASGQVGPSLTHVGSRATLGAVVIQNTPENMRRWATDAQAIKPGVLMPRFNLPEHDAQALADYLEGLK